MEKEKRDSIIAEVKKTLSPKRWQHTLRVVESARQLSKHWGADESKAEFAAYVHDFAKEFTLEQNTAYIKRYGLSEKYLIYPDVTHGHVAAAILSAEYGVADEDILNAVKYHSTGREDMSLLEEVVYLADIIEDGRAYKGIIPIRKLAYIDLNAALIRAIENVLKFVKSQGQEPDEDSIKALAWLNKEKIMDNKQIAEVIVDVLDEKKGIDIVMMDLAEKSGFCDYFIIATGGSERQVKTLSEEAEDKMAELGVPCKNLEGRNTGWILLDYGDIIISIFTAGEREKYNLEKIWADGQFLNRE